MLSPFSQAIRAVCFLAIVCLSHTVALAEEDKIAEQKFSVVLMPDTQYYSEKHPDTYVAQALWIRQQVKQDNIKFVIHLGDIVQTPTQPSQWENADRAMRLLDGVVPYSVAPGNHDMDVKDRDSTLYNQYYSPARFADQPWYGGHLGETNDNNYCFFEASGMKFMILNLEFAPRDETLEWAAGVTKRYPDHRVILATHCYMRPDQRDTNCATAYNLDGNSGEQIWQKFVRKQPNIFLVVSGHVLGVGLQTSVNDAGGKVLEMLTDYQGLPNGGDGWLRSLQFVPSENKIHVKTYSPLLDKHNDDESETFSLDYEMTATGQTPDTALIEKRIEYRNTMKDIVAVLHQNYVNGTDNIDSYLEAELALADVEFALASTKEERLAALQTSLQALQKLEAFQNVRMESGTGRRWGALREGQASFSVFRHRSQSEESAFVCSAPNFAGNNCA